MKIGGIFSIGVLAGVILTIALAFIINAINNETFNSGVTLYEEPGQRILYDSFEVFQVLEDGSALAWENETRFGHELLVLLPPRNGSTYYDNQIVNVPNGQVVREIGSYRYISGQNIVKTVPIVDFFKK